jgi:hypothetical protein
MKYLTYFHMANDGTAPQNRPAIVESMEETTTDDGYGILTLGDAIVAAESGLFVSDAFPSEQDQTYTFVNDDPETTDDEEKRGGRTLEGSFAGVSGKFICAGDAACTAGTDSKNRLATLSGTWTFVPDDKAGYVRNVIPDLDYLSFGYWLETEDGDYSVNAFYDGSQPFTGNDTTFQANDISSLLGNATYTGEATGFYVKKTFDTDANDFVPTSSGQFTAAADLTANFGGAEFGDDSDFEIAGYVTDFRNGDGEMIDAAWKVELKDAPFEVGGTYTATFEGKTATGTGSTPGDWAGEFFGNPKDRNGAPAVNDATTVLAENAPTSVGGEFNAHFAPGGGQDPGHVIGAFGATR